MSTGMWRAAAVVARRYFSLIAVTVVALGVASTTSIFAVVDAVLLRPLPYPAAERLVSIREMRGDDVAGRTSPGRLQDWQQRTMTLASVAGFYVDNFSGQIAGVSVRLAGAVVSPQFFETIGSRPVAGRTFLREEDTPGGPRVAVISNVLAKRYRLAPGSVIRLGADEYGVVGVVPDSVAVPLSTTEVWIAKQARPALLRVRQARNYNVIGRTRPGISPAEVSADLSLIQRELGRIYPATDAGIHVDAIPLKDRIIGGSSATLWPLLAAAVLILLVTCANATCLMVAALPVREAEMRTRVALGATWRNVQWLLIGESLVLAGAGSAAGAALSAAALPLLRRGLADFPRMAELVWHIEITGAVLLQAVLLTAVFAVIPAIWLRRRLSHHVPPARAVITRDRTSRTLVVMQLTLATVLVMSAAALTGILVRLQGTPLGFDVTNVTSLRVTASYNDDSPAQAGARQIRISNALAAVPGVEQVTASADMPGVDAVSAQPFQIVATTMSGTALVRAVTGSYFRTLHIPLENGPSCVENGDPAAAHVAIVNRAFVRQFLGGRDAVGMAVTIGSANSLPLSIVAVAADVREQGYAAGVEPVVYQCGPMRFWPEPFYLVRTALPASSMVSALRAAVASVEPSRAVFGVAPAADLLADTLARPRFQAGLMATFAAIALLLAATGLYGVLAYVVALRKPEIGVRLAVGARRADVAAYVVGRAVRWAGSGIAIGFALVAAVAPLLSRSGYEVVSTEPSAFGLATTVLLVTAACASLLPAWRAGHVSPADLLREAPR